MLRYLAMMVGPLFFSITMYLLHPEGHREILTGLTIVAAVFLWLNKQLP